MVIQIYRKSIIIILSRFKAVTGQRLCHHRIFLFFKLTNFSLNRLLYRWDLLVTVYILVDFDIKTGQNCRNCV